MAIGSRSFISVVLIFKLYGKANYKEWRNAVQDFYEINGLWQYMFREINKLVLLPTQPEGKVHNAVLKEINKAKIMRWLTPTDSFQGVIKSSYNIKLISHVSNMNLCSDIWVKFEIIYWDIGFME